jgi:hypothetical protein
MKSKIDLVLVGVVVVVILSIIATGYLILVLAPQMYEQDIENMNTEARCKTAGGRMGYSKCYKDGKEI